MSCDRLSLQQGTELFRQMKNEKKKSIYIEYLVVLFSLPKMPTNLVTVDQSVYHLYLFHFSPWNVLYILYFTL